MKRLKIIVAIFLFSGVALTPYLSEAQGCTKCGSGMQECYRIMSGNEDHIYHGEAMPCPGDT